MSRLLGTGGAWCIRAMVGATLVLLVSSRASAEDRVVDDDDNFREDVILCEEAVGHLTSCCPGFRASRVSCRYYFYKKESSGCGTHSSYVESVAPALNVNESRCVRAASCSVLRDTGVCARAQDAVEYKERTWSGDGPQPQREVQTHAPVCP